MEIKNPTTGSLVWHLALKWRTQVDRAISRFGLTHAQYSALASLHSMTQRAGPPTQRELADYTGLQAIFMSKLVKALEADGMISRTADQSDSRANRLALTDRGRGIVVEAMAVVRALDRHLTKPLGGPDAEQVRDFAAMLRLLLDQPDKTEPKP